MNDQLRPLVIFVVAIAGLCYLGGIVWVGVASLGSATEPALPPIIPQVIVGIGSTLATHFGAILGVSVWEGSNPHFQLNPMNKVRARAGQQAKPLDTLQVIAAWFYVVSLIVAVLFWVLDGLSPETAEVLRTMTTTFIGVLVGIVAVALNVKKPE